MTEPLALSHVPGLVRAASGPRETFALTDVPADEATMRRYVEVALQGRDDGTMLPFAIVCRSTRRVVGSTRFGYIEYWDWPPSDPRRRGAHLPDAVEIGWTWLSPDAQRTGINRESKLLLLAFAFEVWRVRRVRLRTDARNERSRRAIERLGARFDGVMRADKIAYDGAIRDTAVYSILDSEWPEAKQRLCASLTRDSGGRRTGVPGRDHPSP